MQMLRDNRFQTQISKKNILGRHPGQRYKIIMHIFEYMLPELKPFGCDSSLQGANPQVVFVGL